MMPSSRSLVSMLLPLAAAAVLTGCAEPAPKPVPPPAIVPASPVQAGDLQAQIAKVIPNARIGHVSAINNASGMVAVGGIKIEDVRLHDSVQFIDSGLKTFANGSVTSSDNSHPEYPFVIVEYSPVSGGRRPIVGDVVVYIPR